MSLIKDQKEKTRDEWEAELKQALITGHFPLHCYQSSQNYGFCAVGVKLRKEEPEIAKSLSRCEGKYLPKRILTKEAWDLGMKFHEAITLDKVDDAKRLFDQIQSLPRVLKTEKELIEHDSSIMNKIKDHLP